MALYEVAELMFEVPDGYVDRTVNLFKSPAANRDAPVLSIAITRERRTDESVGQQANALLQRLVKELHGTKVLGQRDRQFDLLEGRESRVHIVRNKMVLYQRHFFFGYYDMFMSAIVSSTRAQSSQCDAVAERFFASLRLRRR